MKKIKILYLHGLGGSVGRSTVANALRDFDCDVHEAELGFFSSVEEFEANIRLAQSMADDIKPDVVVGNSMGGFLALNVKGYMTLLINPCMRPSTRPAYKGTDCVDGLVAMEELYFSAVDAERRSQVFGVFGAADEVLSFYDLFNDIFLISHSAHVTGLGHQLSAKDTEDFVLPMLSRVLRTRDNVSAFEANL